MKYKQLGFEERFAIEKLWNKNIAIRGIAGFLGRSPNTISRELQRNRVLGVYDAKKAHQKHYQRRW